MGDNDNKNKKKEKKGKLDAEGVAKYSFCT